MKTNLRSRIIPFILIITVVIAMMLVLSIPTFAATSKVSGTVYASRLTANDRLELTGDTKLVMDKDLTLGAISGKDYTLSVEGGGTLTLSTEKCALEVGTLVANSDMVIVNSSRKHDAVIVTTDFYFNAGSLRVIGGCGIRSLYGNISIKASSEVNVSARIGAAVIAETGSVNITAPTLWATSAGEESAAEPYGVSGKSGVSLASANATVVGSSYGVYSAAGNISLDGNFDIGARYTAIFAEGGTLRMSGNINCNTTGNNKHCIKADGNITGENLNLTVRGSSGVRSIKGDIVLSGNIIDVVSTHGFAILAEEGSVRINASKLAALCEGGKAEVIYRPEGIGAKKDIYVVVTGSAGITGRDYGVRSETGDINLEGGGNYHIGVTGRENVDDQNNGVGIYAGEGNIELCGNFSIASDKNSAIRVPNGSLTVNGSLEAKGREKKGENIGLYGPFAIEVDNRFSFNGTNLDITGYGGVLITGAGAQEVSIVADSTIINTSCAAGITYGEFVDSRFSVTIDSDYLWIQNRLEEDSNRTQIAIKANGDVTIRSDDATIIGSYGIYSGGDVTLKGDFTVVGTERQAILAIDGHITVEGSLLFSSGMQDGNISYAIYAENFTFIGTTLSTTGYGGICVDEKITITAKLVDIETEYGFALYGNVVRVDSEKVRLLEKGLNEEWNASGLYSSAISYATELTMNVTDAFIYGSRGIRNEQNGSVATLSGNYTVIGTKEHAISACGNVTVNGSLSARSDRKYDDDSWHGCTLDLYNFTFNGTTLAVEGVNVGISAFSGNVDITAENLVVISEQLTAIKAENLKIDAQRATIKGKSGIHIEKDGTLDISGININIEATASNSSAIWSEGNVTLAGNITIKTNGWYGVNAEGNLTINNGYYKINGPKNNAQAVMVGGKLTVDKNLQIVEPSGGHVNGNNINGLGDSPAMYLLMYAAAGEVDIYLSTPSDGQLPIYDSSAIYGLPDRVYFDSIRWFENGAEMESGDRFTAGKTYTAELILAAEEGYYFTDGVLAKVNDKRSSMTGTMDGKTKLMVRVDLGKCSTAITSVSLSITAPVDGNKSSTSVTANGSHYGVRSSNVLWQVSNDGKNYTAMASGAKFVGGKYYRVQMDVTLSNSNYSFKITTKDGYLDSDVLATVNGRLASVSKAYDQDPEEVITVILDFGVCNDTSVEKVAVVDIAEPVAGEYPSYYCNVFGTGYKLNDYSKYEDIYWKNPAEKWYYIKNGIQWWDVTTGSWEYVYDNTPFVPGHKYVCEIRLVTESGYEFAGNGTAITATINGNTAEINAGWTNRTEARVYYTFTCDAKNVTTIMVDGIDTPVTGKKPDHTVSVAYPEFYQIDTTFGNGGIQWYNCEFSKMGFNDVFGDAAPYCLAIRIVSVKSNGVDLVQFANNVKAYVNGKEVTEYGRWDGVKVEGNTVTVYYTFRNMAQAPEVETYSFISQPVGGELKPGESHNTPWQTNFLPTTTEIQYWDGKAWDQWDVQYPQSPLDDYDFESKEAASYRFRIVAYVGNAAVATSNEFTVTWKAAVHICTGVKQNGKEATCTANGWQSYYLCECGKYYSDIACKNQINLTTWKNGAGKIAAGHSGTAEWTKTATAHTKKYTCCQKAVVAQEAHEWNNGICAECMYMCSHTADSNKDHKCDACGIDMGTHEAALGKHTCDYCGKSVTTCADLNKDHKCETCGANVGTHAAAAGKHTCDYCGKTVTECADKNSDGKCDVCGKKIGDCVDANKDHKCDKHGEDMGVHEAALGKHTCDYCGAKLTDCADSNKDHKCDTCGANVGAHAAASGKHTCDYCGAVVTNCSDANKDHKCDTCGANVGVHEAASGKHTCNYCGAKLTECADSNKDGKCDVCGVNLGTETQPAETTAKETEPAVTTARETEPAVTTTKETEPSETTAEATEPEQTSAQITEPEETKSPVTEADTTAEAPEENGCSSTVSLAGIVLLLALGVCAIFIFKKKEKEIL